MRQSPVIPVVPYFASSLGNSARTVIDDIDLSEGYPAEDVIRRVGQLG
jgi:hypothetical protein